MAADPLQEKNQPNQFALYRTYHARVSHALGSGVDLGEILTQVMDAVIGLTGGERGILALGAADIPIWQAGSGRRAGQESWQSNELGLARKAIEAVLESGAGVIVADTANDPRYASQIPEDEAAPHSLLCAPLLVSGQAIGAIYVDDRQRAGLFTDSDLEVLGAFAAQAAAAIENERLRQTIQQESQSRAKFVSVVTHELRIPMTSIKGYTDLLRQGAVGPVNDMQLNFLNVVRNNVERMSALVSDLADLARIETGRMKLESAMIPVDAYVEEALRELRPRLEEKSQTLEVDLSPGLPHVFADPNRLAQILSNLFSNAWKYTPSGGKVCITACPEGDFVRLEVADTGVGISEQDLPRLSTQFFRSDDPAVREQQGWGLGLSVVSGLVELMGGGFTVQSQLGEGSRFGFTLPTAPRVVISVQEQYHLQLVIFDNKPKGGSPV